MGRGKYQYMQPSDLPDDYNITHHDIWLGLKEVTSAHGIPHVTRARGLVKKAFWSVTVFLTVGALIYNMYAISKLFADHPVTVSISLFHENELVFPAVTICNMSPVRKSSLENSTAVQDALDRKRRRRRRRKRAAAGSTYCDAGWAMYNQSCYYVSIPGDEEENMAVRTACDALSSTPVTIANQAEQDFVESITTDLTNDHFWMGLYNFNSTLPNNWGWWGADAVTYLNWASGEPDNSGPCARLAQNGIWRDYDCGVQFRYVCEKLANIYSTQAPEQDVTTEVPTTETPTTMKTDAKEPYTTTDQTDSTPTAEDPTHQPSAASSCCCSCCFETDLYGSGSCSTCDAHTALDASTCSYNSWIQDPIIIPTGSLPVEEEPEPQPVEGSKFPERVETRENFKEEEKLTEALADVDDTEKAILGTKAEDLILDCQYSGYDCYLRDFTQFHNPIHGNCYVFNSGWNTTTELRKSHRAGRRHGLHLTINIDQDEYVEEVGDTAGLRLVIHSQDRMPFPEDEGITIETGHSTSLGIRQVIIERQPDPYGSCRSPSTVDYSRNVFQELYPVKYSTTSCTKTCYQKHLIKTCGCGDPEVPMNGRAFGDEFVQACDSSDIEQSDCKYEVNKLYNENKLECSCPSSCRDVDFQLEVSTGVWPSNVQKREVLERLAPKIGDMLSDPSNPDKYKDNLIKLEIYYEEFNFEQITERPSYPPQSYLSDLGGVLGLWLGMSILSIGEFIEFFLDLVVLRCASFGSGNRVKSLESNKEKSLSTISETKLGGGKSLTYHNGSTDTAANSMPPINHSTNGNSLKGWNSSSGSAGRKHGSARKMVTSADNVEMREASPPPPYTSRAASGASGRTRSSVLSQGRSRSSRSQLQDDGDPTERYLLSV